MAAEISPEEVRLFTISSEVPEAKSLKKSTFTNAQEHDVPTEYGAVRVAVQGNTKKPAILTYHDIGLNHSTCFQGFFHNSDMVTLLEHFCVYHINAPGQHESAETIMIHGKANNQKGYSYPTMDQLADTVHAVLMFFERKSVIGFGVGAGANILSRVALRYPKLVEGLVLVNPEAGQCGWAEWGYQKMNSWYLKSGKLTHFTEDYLLWHWFGRATKDNNTDLVHCYKEYIHTINPVNLSLFIDSYCGRTDLNIRRPPDQLHKQDINCIRCQSMIVVGDHGPNVDEAVDMNSRMDPANTTFVKLADCGGMVLEESPANLVESVRLFLQGLGYVPFLSQAKMVEARKKRSAIPTDVSSLGNGSGEVEMTTFQTPAVDC